VAKQSIYTVGGTVQAGGGLYLPRKVDEELLALCHAGTFAYVLTSRQMGKSSLMVRTAERLIEGGIHAVIIDLTQLGTQLTAAEWYLGLLTIIADSLMLETDVMSWWQAHAYLGVTQRLTRFFQEILLAEVKNPPVQCPRPRARVSAALLRAHRCCNSQRSHQRSPTHAFQYRPAR